MSTQNNPQSQANIPGRPNEPNRALEALLRVFQTSFFSFHYMNKYMPHTDLVVGTDIRQVRKDCEAYCKRFSLRFCSVRPAVLDLKAVPTTDGDIALPPGPDGNLLLSAQAKKEESR